MSERVHIYLREDQIGWVRDNDDFNLSGFVRDKLDEEIERRNS